MPTAMPHFSKCEVCVGGWLHIYFLSNGAPALPPPPLPKISLQEQPFFTLCTFRAFMTEWEQSVACNQRLISICAAAARLAPASLIYGGGSLVLCQAVWGNYAVLMQN